MKELRINNSIYINPFLAYSLFWIVALILYHISPSKLNVKIDGILLVFLILFIIISFLFSIVFSIQIKKYTFKIKKTKIPKIIVFGLLCFYIIEFIYSKNIPLLSVLSGSQSDAPYTFGIPTVHVIGVTFNSFFCIYTFFQYIMFKEKRKLLYFLISFSFYLLIYSRGMLIFVAFCCVLLFLISRQKIKLKTYLLLAIAAIIGLWGFGVLGNLRVGSQWNDSSVIMQLNKIDGDKNSLLSPFYWVEQYFTVSVRNLNHNLSKFVSIDIEDFLYSINIDFLAKRFFPNVLIEYDLAAEGMTTGTAYIYSYLAGGYIGIIVTFVIYIFAGLLITNVKFYDNSCKLIALAILFFCFALTIFENMLLYSGYSFSLVFCILFSFIYSKIHKWKSKRKEK